MRNSNIELLRIVAMLAIVAHHYVVNSTVTNLFDPLHPTANQIFLQFWGMWGKTAINVFVLITGYFMCENQLTMKRYCKILFEIIFYSWMMYFVLAIFGYETITWKGVADRLFLSNILRNQNNGFVPAFMWMYLLIPAMNVYVRNAAKRNFYWTVGVLLTMFTICGTFFKANVYHHVFWYATMYLVGALVRLHPMMWMLRNRFCLPLLCIGVVTGWFSILISDVSTLYYGRPLISEWALIWNSHKLVAFVVALMAFLVFRNWRLPQSHFINTVAATSFGVLLIHGASDGMRKFLWEDFVDVSAAYSLPFHALVGYSFLVMIGVFAVCSVIDYVRICLIERPLFKLWAN